MQTADAFLGALMLLLLPAVVSDVARQRIPLGLPAAIAALGCAQAWLAAPTQATLLNCGVQTALLGGLLFGILGLLRRFRPQATAMSAGDAALLTASAGWVGVSGCMVIMFVASLTLLAMTLAVAPWQGFDFKRERPFGPGLALGLLGLLVSSRLHHP